MPETKENCWEILQYFWQRPSESRLQLNMVTGISMLGHMKRGGHSASLEYDVIGGYNVVWKLEGGAANTCENDSNELIQHKTLGWKVAWWS